MPRLLMVAMTLSLLATACTREVVAVAQDSEADVQGGISVSGQGEVTGMPDTLTIDLGVSVLRPSTGEAIAEAARLAESVISALHEAGVAERDIQTREYSVWPEHDWERESPTVVGYRVSNVLTVKIRDLERAGEVIDAATAAAGDQAVVHGVHFDLEDNQALVEAARAAAWEDAKSKAEQLASLAGSRLGPVLAISETFSTAPPPFSFDAAAEPLATPIEPGRLAVTVHISVRFALGP